MEDFDTDYDYFQAEEDALNAAAHQHNLESQRLEEESKELLENVIDATKRLEFMLDNIRLFELFKGAGYDNRNSH